MRLWTVHPKYLDAKGLVALWREALLAKAVLEGKTKGYRNHPQLVRFQDQADPVGYVSEYLRAVLSDSLERGYKFDASKIPATAQELPPIEETAGQLDYEWGHLLKKLQVRDETRYHQCAALTDYQHHPMFCMTPGDVRDWEKVN